MRFGVPMMNTDIRSDRQLFPAEITRVLVVAAGNSNAVVDERVEGSSLANERKAYARA
jgi:hypothetical protein